MKKKDKYMVLHSNKSQRFFLCFIFFLKRQIIINFKKCYPTTISNDFTLYHTEMNGVVNRTLYHSK